MRRPVCKRCGGGEFREYGDVQIEVFSEIARPVDEVEIHADGSVSVTVGKIDLEDVRAQIDDVEPCDFLTFHGFECATCALAEDKIEDLVIEEPAIGDRLNLPDGRSATINALKIHPRDGIEVFAASEWWDFDDVELWQPHPGQQALEVAS